MLPDPGVVGEFAINGSLVPLPAAITEGDGKDMLKPCLGCCRLKVFNKIILAFRSPKKYASFPLPLPPDFLFDSLNASYKNMAELGQSI